jgi:hypothetical protein
MVGTPVPELKVSCRNVVYLKPRILRGFFPLPLFQEMPRYENHIETGLGEKTGFSRCVPNLDCFTLSWIFGVEDSSSVLAIISI